MSEIKISKYYSSQENTSDLNFEYDTESLRPAWIHVKDKNFNARFLSITTNTDSEIIYKKFTGNFYYPVDLIINKKDEKER